MTPGEYVDGTGTWVVDRQYGRQFRAETLRLSAPTSPAGIEKYLGSGLVKGIGPVFAHRLVDAFGPAVFAVIESEPDRLQDVPGIGPGRATRIRQGWQDQKTIRDIMVFLHSHGVSTSQAVRIFKTYGTAAIDRVRENPYRLARDIRGIGFRSADKIASHLGIAPTDPLRVQAGVSFALLEATGPVPFLPVSPGLNRRSPAGCRRWRRARPPGRCFRWTPRSPKRKPACSWRSPRVSGRRSTTRSPTSSRPSPEGPVSGRPRWSGAS